MSAMLALGLGSIVSGLFGASSASKAAKAQEAATQASIEEQRRQYDLSRSDFEPFRQSGLNALAAQQSMLGLGPAPQIGGGGVNALTGGSSLDGVTLPDIIERQKQVGTKQVAHTFTGDDDWRNYAETVPVYDGTEYAVGDVSFADRLDADAYRQRLGALAGGSQAQQGGSRGQWSWETTPGYQFRMDEGQKALQRRAAANGNRMGGASLKEAMRYGQGLASDEYWNVYNALGAMSGSGQAATQNSASLGASTANNISNSLLAGGDARASGYSGVNNAFQGTMGNLASLYGMNQAGYFG